MEKGLSQKDCAKKINEKPSILQDYESGKAIPKIQILFKLEGVLGVKFRGTSTLSWRRHVTDADFQVLTSERSWRGRRSRRHGFVELGWQRLLRYVTENADMPTVSVTRNKSSTWHEQRF